MVRKEITIIEEHLKRVEAGVSLHTGMMNSFAATKAGGLSRLHSKPESSRTGTAFALFVLSQAGLLKQQLDGKAVSSAQSFVKETVAKKVGPINVGGDKGLNEYSVPIWICGILQALPKGSLADAEATKVAEALKSVLAEVKSTKGHLRRVGIGFGETAPSAYLTYWAACSLIAAKSLFDSGFVPTSDLDEAMSLIAQWAELELSRLVANHHAGLLSRFDVVECISAACTVARLRYKQSPRLADESTQLSVYGAALALDSYFSGGSFRLSRPVFADQKHNSVLCPTSEALFMVLSSFSRREQASLFSGARLDKLMESFDWCQRNVREEGFPPDFDVSLGGGGEVNVFSTASTLAFFSALAALLDNLLDDMARKALGVPVDPPRKAWGYPAAFKATAEEQIVQPLTAGPIERAKYSLMLYGPPGTAKTSLAQQVAFDLNWPLKVITQSDFMRSGEGMIDAEAELVFYLCSQLKQVVLLFDELEELILARHVGGTDKGSRLLTTSMLPKIHELRDRKRVVFIFATNRLSSIDAAATRLGRFDFRFGLDYPDEKALAAVAEDTSGKLEEIEDRLVVAEIKKAKVPSLLKEYMAQRKVTRPLLTFKDIAYVVETMYVRARHNQQGPKRGRVDVLQGALGDIDVIHKANSNEDYEAFEKLKTWADRL